MPVNTPRDDYNTNLPIWTKARDVVEGQERIHIKGEKYLPALSGQDAAEYSAYVDRALFYNATQRTVDAMVGLLFRKSPIVDIPDALKELTENIDSEGNKLDAFVQDMANEIMIVGRYGLLVEHPQSIDSDGQTTQAQAEAFNLRPFFIKYATEDIINWKSENINNQTVLTFVVLREFSEVSDADDEFKIGVVERYRVLDLDENGDYRQRIYEDTSGGNSSFMQVGDDIFPKANGASITSIPFLLLSAKGVSVDIEKSPSIDLVNTNLSHYKSTADLEHGAHFTGLPTAVVIGHKLEESEVLKIGSADAWVFAEDTVKVQYLEFTGQGLGTLERSLERKEHQMATLGARMLANEKASAETEESHVIKRQGENSALTSISNAISGFTTDVLTILAEWAGISGDISYEINKDFIPTKMKSDEMIAQLQLLQSGAISYNVFFENLQKGEIISGEKTIEEMQTEIETTGPSFSGTGFDDPVDTNEQI